MRAKLLPLLDQALEVAARRTVERGLKHTDYVLQDEVKELLVEAFLRFAWEEINERFEFDDE